MRRTCGISFNVVPGETAGFLGPNGAGETTATSTHCPLTCPTSGRATVAGFDVAHRRNRCVSPSGWSVTSE